MKPNIDVNLRWEQFRGMDSGIISSTAYRVAQMTSFQNAEPVHTKTVSPISHTKGSIIVLIRTMYEITQPSRRSCMSKLVK